MAGQNITDPKYYQDDRNEFASIYLPGGVATVDVVIGYTDRSIVIESVEVLFPLIVGVGTGVTVQLWHAAVGSNNLANGTAITEAAALNNSPLTMRRFPLTFVKTGGKPSENIIPAGRIWGLRYAVAGGTPNIAAGSCQIRFSSLIK